jgi:hypothetical protein
MLAMCAPWINSKIILKPIFLSFSDFCSHQKSVLYFAEAIASKEKVFDAVKCDSWANFTSGACKDNEVANMKIRSNLTGNFYLQTNANSPFSRGKAGLTYEASP